MDGRPLWYVAYGSNLDANRLSAYLDGGVHGDTGHVHPGADDPAAPTGQRVVTVPGGLWFGGRSPKWDGGTAHFDRDGEARVIGRAWRLTATQVADLAAQECGREPGTVEMQVAVTDRGGVVVPGARYGVVVPLEPIDGEAAVTLTFEVRPGARDPSPGYLAAMVRGLRQCGLDDGAVRDYLAGDHGVAADLVDEALGRV